MILDEKLHTKRSFCGLCKLHHMIWYGQMLMSESIERSNKTVQFESGNARTFTFPHMKHFYSGWIIFVQIIVQIHDLTEIYIFLEYITKQRKKWSLIVQNVIGSSLQLIQSNFFSLRRDFQRFFFLWFDSLLYLTHSYACET